MSRTQWVISRVGNEENTHRHDMWHISRTQWVTLQVREEENTHNIICDTCHELNESYHKQGGGEYTQTRHVTHVTNSMSHVASPGGGKYTQHYTWHMSRTQWVRSRVNVKCHVSSCGPPPPPPWRFSFSHTYTHTHTLPLTPHTPHTLSLWHTHIHTPFADLLVLDAVPSSSSSSSFSTSFLTAFPLAFLVFFAAGNNSKKSALRSFL